MSSSRSSICGCYHQQQQQQQHQNNNNNNKNYRKNQQTILNHDGGGCGGDLNSKHHHHPYMKIIRKNDDDNNDWLSIEKLSINPAIATTTNNTKSSSSTTLLSSSNRLLLLRKWPINCLLLNNNNKSTTTTTTKTTTTTTKMMFMMATLIIILLNIIINIEQSQQQNQQEIFTNSFHIRFRRNVDQFDAHQIAKRYGFINLGPILGSKREYHFQHRAIPHARTKRNIGHYRKLRSDHLIESAQQQLGFRRIKRGYKSLVLNEIENLQLEQYPNDPLFQYQWYLKNTGQNGGKPRLDLNVEAAWAQGITGKNVTTAIMDDGVDYMHPDLKDNYNAKASYDFSSNDPYPYPRYTDDWFNSHGTRCAGEVAAKRDNGICGVGVAYDSKVAGIRMLDQPYMTDLIEANSMGHEPDLIDIYSASWGPTDDGKTVDGPRNATMRAIVRGVNEGRRGLGNIYVWASGDGGEDDDCNCDGYAASMWTISINSAINDGQNAHYDESCSSTLASTFSNGAKDPHTGVATTDLYGRCTKTHSGTSAAAPEAAGVFALALEANPTLTWRDIQHLCVLTSKRNSLYDSKKRFFWNMNGVGLEFNHLFGYGVLDAGAMVALSKKWKTVPPRYHCEAGQINSDRLSIPTNRSLTLKIETNACQNQDTEVNYIEHVQAVITLNSTRRGDVLLYLISPMGTKSMILSRRPNDDDGHDGFVKWPFMTTHTWGENPRGIWRLEVAHSGPEPQQGFIKEWILMIHGTKEQPYKDLPVEDNNSKLAIVKKAHEDAKKI